MSTFARRRFLKLAGAAGALSMLAPFSAFGGTGPRVVVVGGGIGGATVSKYLRLWGPDIQVTLVDPAAAHKACILSNLVVTNLLSMDRITLSYSALRSTYGVQVLAAKAVALDPTVNQLVVSSSGVRQVLEYDHLVLSPGIEFVPPPAGVWDPKLTPHAWQAGSQTTLLRKQLAGMAANDVFVMTVPPAPYRCPPGPYERACMVADYLERRGRNGAKVIVLDANPGIQAEPETFTHAFNVIHKGVIEYVPNAVVQEVDSPTHSITTTAGTIRNAKVLNYIPAQRAPRIAARLGVNAAGFVPVNPLDYSVAGYPNVHVIGDASAVPASDGKGVPKSGHMANSEAKVCADAIVRTLTGEPLDRNVATSSACYSPVTSKLASWLSANFVYGDIYTLDGQVKGKGMHRVDLGEAPKITSDGYEDMFTWADTLFVDSFG